MQGNKNTKKNNVIMLPQATKVIGLEIRVNKIKFMTSTIQPRRRLIMKVINTLKTDAI